MMLSWTKLLLICAFALNGRQAWAHQVDSTVYCNNFGNQLTLRADSSFYYTFRFDLVFWWTSGRWRRDGVYLILQPIELYDTVLTNDGSGTQLRQLEPAEFHTPQLRYSVGRVRSNAEQRRELAPDSLKVVNTRLYDVRNGKLIRRRYPLLRSRGRNIPASYSACMP